MRKKSYKLRQLGDVDAVIAAAPTVVEAARRLGVDTSTIRRWRAAGKISGGLALERSVASNGQKPKKTLVASDDESAEGVTLTFPLEVLLDGPRPGRDDLEADRQWLEQRKFVHQLCDPRFDPREVLGLDPAGIVRWRAERLAWLAETLAGQKQKEQSFGKI
jgi:hypothetical protein